MRRRSATLLAGALLLAALVALSWQVKVPYVELTPGPTWNTLGKDKGHEVIQVSGTSVPVLSSKGQLRMVTVGVTDDITLIEALRGWLNSSDAVVPREVIYPPDQTQQQVDKANQEDFKNSQNSAETAALRQLGYPVQVTVSQVMAGLPAVGKLAVGDVITSVDGTSVTSATKLTQLIHAHPVGTALTIGYQRSSVVGTVSLTSARAADGTPRIGVGVDQKQPHPFQVTISLNDVGGPSAGLMFTLAIIDKVKGQDLTGGLTIAGTGTIDDDGAVGAIGGIPQKMRGAKRDGATVFLVPADNCAEAVANAVPGLELVRVSNLDEALTSLADLRAHTTPRLCGGR